MESLRREYNHNYSVPLFEKEGLGEILLDKSPSAPSLCSPHFSKGEVNTYAKVAIESPITNRFNQGFYVVLVVASYLITGCFG